jgi:hypothetical protein
LGVVVGVARLCAQMAFRNARGTWRNIYEWAPSPLSTLRMVDATGRQAQAFLEQAPAPKDDGDVLVIQVDAGAAPMIGEQEYERRCGPHGERRVDGNADPPCSDGRGRPLGQRGRASCRRLVTRDGCGLTTPPKCALRRALDTDCASPP